MEYLWLGLGGCLGANLRYIVGQLIVTRLGAAFPFGTFLINASGSFLIGVLLTLLTERLVVDPFWRLLLVAGFLGSYTTFSSYTYEALALAEEGLWGRAALYNVVGLMACYGGMIVARTAGR